MNKKLKTILTASLALNILLIGFVLGRGAGMIRHDKPKDHFAMKEERIIQVLPAEKQEEARNILQRMQEIRKDKFKKDKLVFKEVEAQVLAKNFDEARFLEEMSKLDSSMILVKTESDKVLAGFLKTLNQDERKDLLEEFKSMHKFFRGDKFNRKDDRHKEDRDENRRFERK